MNSSLYVCMHVTLPSEEAAVGYFCGIPYIVLNPLFVWPVNPAARKDQCQTLSHAFNLSTQNCIDNLRQ